MGYIKPGDVKSPLNKVSDVTVIFDGGDDELAVATMTYSGYPSVGLRWNGNSKKPLGYPSSRNKSVWVVIPNKGRLDEVVKWIGEELHAGRSISFPLTTESMVKALTERGFKVTLSL
jgi:hypothetical protein